MSSPLIDIGISLVSGATAGGLTARVVVTRISSGRSAVRGERNVIDSELRSHDRQDRSIRQKVRRGDAVVGNKTTHKSPKR